MSYCPKNNRMNIVILFSIILTSIMITISIFIDQNKKQSGDIYTFIDNSGNPISNEYHISSIILSIISTLFTIYIIYSTNFEKYWENTKLSDIVPLRFIGDTGDVSGASSYDIYKYNEDYPCYARNTEKSCELKPNSRECHWDDYDGVCKKTYSGGYFNILIFAACSIYLIVFGIMIHKDKDKNIDNYSFDNLGTASIIIGSIGIIYTFIDLFIC